MLSFRYHALTIVAVFLALAIGVVLGVAIGDSGAVSGARKDLEQSLRGDLDRARDRNADLRSEIEVRDAYENETFPTLVRGLLRRDRIGVIGLGGLPDGVVADVRSAIEPAGAELTSVNVIEMPLPTSDIASDLRPSPLARMGRSERALERFGRQLGRQMARGGRLPQRVRDSAFSSSRGDFRRLRGVVLVRADFELDGEQGEQTEVFEKAFIEGLRASRAQIVGVESEDADPSQIDFMKANDLSTVDELTLVAGRAAVVYVLAGAEGNYGTGEADLVPPRPKRR